MFLSKSNEPVIAFNEVCNHDIAVIVAIDIKDAKDSVGLVLGEHRHNAVIAAKEQNCSKRQTFLIGIRIFQDESAASKHLFITHIQPCVMLSINTSHSSCSLQKILAQSSNRNRRIHLVHEISVLLSRIKLKNQISVVGDIDIGVVIAVVNTPGTAINRLSRRNVNIKDRFAILFILFRREIKRRKHFRLIVNRRHKIFFDLHNTIRLNTCDCSIVFYSEKNMSAITVGKSADGFVNIFCNIRS